MQTAESREQEVAAQRDQLETVWRQEQDRMSKYKAQLDAEFEKQSKELQDELSRVRAREAELEAREKDLTSRERELIWSRRELEVGRANLETAMARWNLEKAVASGSDVKLPDKTKSMASESTRARVRIVPFTDLNISIDVTVPAAAQTESRPPLQERA